MAAIATSLGRIKTSNRTNYHAGVESPMTVIPLSDANELPVSHSNRPSSPFRDGSSLRNTQQSRGPLNTAVPLFVPGEQQRPAHLGTKDGYDPIPLNCGSCGYKGYTYVRHSKGVGHIFWVTMTCGLGLLCPAALDAHHFCQQCHKKVAVAKPL
eukprot:jgi/Botrbrau1/11625/Bobra.0209s0016.1